MLRPAPARLTRYPAGRLQQQRTLGALALAARLPPAAPPPLRLVAPPADPAELRRITLLVVEVLSGARAPHQLAPWTTDRIAPALLRPRSARAGRLRSAAARMLTWRMQEPGPGVAEVSAVVLACGRHHAIALRFEPVGARWCCAAIETTIPVH